MKADDDIYSELVAEKSAYLYCDACGYYPLEPVHGHFQCSACNYITKCCEGGALEI